ncbi:MAG: hypothetical protein ACO1N9_09260 [Flavobacterium sp.]
MWLKYIIPVLFFLSVQAYGQVKVGTSYITNVSLSVKLCEKGYDKCENLLGTYEIDKNIKFTIIGFTEDNNIIVRLWRFKGSEQPESSVNIISDKSEEESELIQNSSEYITEEANGNKFIVSLTDLNDKCDLYHTTKYSFTSGITTVPIKLRFGDRNEVEEGESPRYFDFLQNFNLGLSIGINKTFQSKTKQSISFLISPAITTAEVSTTSLRTLPATPTVPPTDPPTAETTQVTTSEQSAAFSLSYGIIYEFNAFQVGVFSGWDWIPNELGQNWKYQGKPWLGLALGISIFKSNTEGSGSSETNKSK